MSHFSNPFQKGSLTYSYATTIQQCVITGCNSRKQCSSGDAAPTCAIVLNVLCAATDRWFLMKLRQGCSRTAFQQTRSSAVWRCWGCHQRICRGMTVFSSTLWRKRWLGESDLVPFCFLALYHLLLTVSTWCTCVLYIMTALPALSQVNTTNAKKNWLLKTPSSG